MSMQVKIIAILTARPGKAAELRSLLDHMLAASRQEAGNLRYEIWRNQTDADQFVLDELYVDGEALEAHRVTAHFKAYLSVINDLAERSSIVLAPVSTA